MMTNKFNALNKDFFNTTVILFLKTDNTFQKEYEYLSIFHRFIQKVVEERKYEYLYGISVVMMHNSVHHLLQRVYFYKKKKSFIKILAEILQQSKGTFEGLKMILPSIYARVGLFMIIHELTFGKNGEKVLKKIHRDFPNLFKNVETIFIDCINQNYNESFAISDQAKIGLRDCMKTFLGCLISFFFNLSALTKTNKEENIVGCWYKYNKTTIKGIWRFWKKNKKSEDIVENCSLLLENISHLQDISNSCIANMDDVFTYESFSGPNYTCRILCNVIQTLLRKEKTKKFKNFLKNDIIFKRCIKGAISKNKKLRMQCIEVIDQLVTVKSSRKRIVELKLGKSLEKLKNCRYKEVKSIGEKLITSLEIYNKENSKLIRPSLLCCYCKIEAKKLMKCARCRKVFYCGRECQKKDWKEHKKFCKKPKKDEEKYIMRQKDAIKGKTQMTAYLNSHFPEIMQKMATRYLTFRNCVVELDLCTIPKVEIKTDEEFFSTLPGDDENAEKFKLWKKKKKETPKPVAMIVTAFLGENGVVYKRGDLLGF